MNFSSWCSNYGRCDLDVCLFVCFTLMLFLSVCNVYVLDLVSLSLFCWDFYFPSCLVVFFLWVFYFPGNFHFGKGPNLFYNFVFILRYWNLGQIILHKSVENCPNVNWMIKPWQWITCFRLPFYFGRAVHMLGQMFDCLIFEGRAMVWQSRVWLNLILGGSNVMAVKDFTIPHLRGEQYYDNQRFLLYLIWGGSIVMAVKDLTIAHFRGSIVMAVKRVV